MNSIKRIVLLLCLALIPGMAQAVNYTIVNKSDNDLDVTLLGGSHNENAFFHRIPKGQTYNGKRDCTQKVMLSPVALVGQVAQSSWALALSDQVCHRNWSLTIEGGAAQGFQILTERFQND